MAWTHLARRRPCPYAPQGGFLLAESVQAHTDVASIRGIGLSLIGLAATQKVAEHRPENALRIAAAAEYTTPRRGS